MKVGALVIYTEGVDRKTGEPIEFNALILGERVVAGHEGEDGEPLLTLCFAKERTDAAGIPLPVHGTGQTSELIQVRLDVAHESHEYTPEQQQAYGKKQYDGGRWREVEYKIAAKELPSPAQIQAPQLPAPVVPGAPAETPITAESLGLTDAGEKKEE